MDKELPTTADPQPEIPLQHFGGTVPRALLGSAATGKR